LQAWRIWPCQIVTALCLALIALTTPAVRAGEFQIALYHTSLARSGPGLLLDAIRRTGDPQVEAVVTVIADVSPDLLVLLDIDHDRDLVTLKALRDRIADHGAVYPHVFALQPNTGMQTGLDLNRDGRFGGPKDAQGYGEFPGQGGMAILSRHRIMTDSVQDFTALLWRDLPDALLSLPDGTALLTAEELKVQRLSSTGHWAVPLDVDGQPLWLLVFHATPPVFDGPEDRNGRRNHDEVRFWTHYLDGIFEPPPKTRFVIIGDSNMDTADSEGRPEAMNALLTDPRLSDPFPRGGGMSEADPDHRGDPRLDTARWPAPGPGNLRVDYILPSADLTIRDARVHWPEPQDQMATVTRAASRHHMVSVTLDWPPSDTSLAE
jgi:hypothetical protein